MRYDYRSQYKGWGAKEIEKHLIYLKEKLSLNLGICQSNVDYYFKRISYLENKLK